MTATPEPRLLGPQSTLFDHALRLHRDTPDAPLARDGEPLPDDGHHRGRARPNEPRNWRSDGAEAASILDTYFARPSASPSDLVAELHTIHVPIHPNEHITAAGRRADEHKVRETGRWLVRHSTDRCAVTMGLALLTTVHDEQDIPLIQTIGLLSHHFGPLAARALERRRGGAQALLWLAERVAGWGRVYIVEALCKVSGSDTRPWLLRHACDGDYLNGYFAGTVATVTHLHEAITSADPDSDLLDHTGRLLAIMSDCDGMGMALAGYPPAVEVLEAHAHHTRCLDPTLERYVTAAQLACYLSETASHVLAWPQGRREQVRDRYLSVLNREDWSDVARAGHAADDHRVTWLASTAAPQLGLRAFTDTSTVRSSKHISGTC